MEFAEVKRKSKAPGVVVKVLGGKYQDRLRKLACENVTFDLICTDPPYGTLENVWDQALDYNEMWALLKPIVHRKTIIVLFGQNVEGNPMFAQLVASNPKWFRFEMIWDKKTGHSGSTGSKPMIHIHENIAVFSPSPIEKPQMYAENFDSYLVKHGVHVSRGSLTKESIEKLTSVESMLRLMTEEEVRKLTNIESVIRLVVGKNKRCQHTAGKPIVLMQYIIELFSAPGSKVLDFTMGSGNSLMAAVLSGRHYVGIELMESIIRNSAQNCWKSVLEDPNLVATYNIEWAGAIPGRDTGLGSRVTNSFTDLNIPLQSSKDNWLSILIESPIVTLSPIPVPVPRRVLKSQTKNPSIPRDLSYVPPDVSSIPRDLSYVPPDVPTGVSYI